MPTWIERCENHSYPESQFAQKIPKTLCQFLLFQAVKKHDTSRFELGGFRLPATEAFKGCDNSAYPNITPNKYPTIEKNRTHPTEAFTLLLDQTTTSDLSAARSATSHAARGSGKIHVAYVLNQQMWPDWIVTYTSSGYNLYTAEIPLIDIDFSWPSDASEIHISKKYNHQVMSMCAAGPTAPSSQSMLRKTRKSLCLQKSEDRNRLIHYA